jgi:hypothetical protein
VRGRSLRQCAPHRPRSARAPLPIGDGERGNTARLDIPVAAHGAFLVRPLAPRDSLPRPPPVARPGFPIPAPMMRT